MRGTPAANYNTPSGMVVRAGPWRKSREMPLGKNGKEGPAMATGASGNTWKAPIKTILVDGLLLSLAGVVAYVSVVYLCHQGLQVRGVWRHATVPSVMYALGLGYHNCDKEKIPALNDFIGRRVDRLDYNAMPATVPTVPLDYYQWRWNGLLMFVGVYWRLAGIAWDNLPPLFGAVAAGIAMMVYLFFRITLNRLAAVVGCALWLCSPVQLFEASNLRDYFKAFFIIGGVAVLGVVVRHALKPWVLYGIALFMGIFISVGMRFRDDVIMMLPFALLMIACFPEGALKATWQRRILACAVLLLAFLGTSWSYLQSLHREGNHSPQNISMGFTQEYEQRLGLGGVPYDLGPVWNDALTFSTINSYGQRAKGLHAPYYEPSAAYDAMGRAFLLDVVRTFPADRLRFAYASVRQNLNEMPFWQQGMYVDHPTIMIPPILTLHEWRWRVLGWIQGWGVLIALFAILALSAWNLRLGLAAMVFVLYIGGYSALQYDVRHAFHTEILLWWTLLLLITLGVSAYRAIRKTGMPPWRPMLLRSAITGVILVLGLGIPLVLAQAWQHRTVGMLYARLFSIPWTPVTTAAQPSKSAERMQGSVLLPVPGLGEGPSSSRPKDSFTAWSDYLAIELQGTGERIPVRLEYERNMNFAGFSRDFVLPAGTHGGAGSTFLFTPVYTVQKQGKPMSTFQGIAIRQKDVQHIRAIYRTSDTGPLKLWPTVFLDAAWQKAPRHLTWQKRPRLWTERRARIREENLIANGEFASWFEDARPAGFQLPQECAVLQKIPSEAGPGTFACKQVWSKADAGQSVEKQFGVRLGRLKSDMVYELMVTADNRTGEPIRLTAWQIGRTETGEPILERLAFSVATLRRAPGRQECGGYFRTTCVEGLDVIVTACYNGKKFPAEVVWEQWSVTPLR